MLFMKKEDLGLKPQKMIELLEEENLLMLLLFKEGLNIEYILKEVLGYRLLLDIISKIRKMAMREFLEKLLMLLLSKEKLMLLDIK